MDLTLGPRPAARARMQTASLAHGGGAKREVCSWLAEAVSICCPMTRAKGVLPLIGIHARRQVLDLALLHIKECLQDVDGLLVDLLIVVVLQLLDLVEAIRLIDEGGVGVVGAYVLALLHLAHLHNSMALLTMQEGPAVLMPASSSLQRLERQQQMHLDMNFSSTDTPCNCSHLNNTPSCRESMLATGAKHKAHLENVLQALEGHCDDAHIRAGQQIAQRLDAAGTDKKFDLLLRAA